MSVCGIVYCAVFIGYRIHATRYILYFKRIAATFFVNFFTAIISVLNYSNEIFLIQQWYE